jgi:hypothetical protein
MDLGAVSDGKDEWEMELQPIPGLERVGLDDWESLLSESPPSQDQSLLRWISDDGSFNLNPNEIDGNNEVSAMETLPGGCVTGNVPTNSTSLFDFGNPSFCNPPFSEQKPQILNQEMGMINPHQIHPNLNMFPQLIFTPEEHQQIEPHPKRHNPGIPNSISQIPKMPLSEQNNELLLRKQSSLLPQFGGNYFPPFMVPKQEPFSSGNNHQQVTYDHLYKAAELILVGNFAHAQAILARLNHHLSTVEKPYQRAGFYFKEALQTPLLPPSAAASLPSRIPTPFDAMLKMGAYRVLSEVSPLVQFMNFTSNQTLIEALDGSKFIHVIDFDIGFGAQWASFIQELNPKKVSALKITAFASPTTHHPFELGLMHETLTKLADESGIRFELEVVNFDSFDPSADSVNHFRSFDDEAIAVNFPSWSSSSRLTALPALLRFIKQLKPKIVVSMDQPSERSDLPFPQHVMHGLDHYEALLSSIDAANVTPDTSSKIERFLINQRIEMMVLGRLHCPDQMPHWKGLFSSAGFTAVPLSGLAEAQAECLVKRSQVRGFHVEKRELMLGLFWQRKELVAATAWKC